MRTEAQNKALHQALRMLGNPKSYPWKDVACSLHGLSMLAIDLQADTKDLTDIRFTAIHLQFEEHGQ